MDIPVEGEAAREAPDASTTVVINGQFPVTHGMEVVGRDGGHVGVLKEVAAHSILVDRPWHRDSYVPFEAIRAVAGAQLVLSLAAAEVDRMDWPKPSLF